MRARIDAGRRPVVVDEASKHRQSYQTPRVRGWFPQFRIRIRDPMDRLRWTGPVVVADVPGDDGTDVVLAEEDEVIRRFLPQRPHEAFDLGGCALSVQALSRK